MQESEFETIVCKVVVILSRPLCVNTLRSRQNGRHFPDIFKWIFLNENVWISINISLKFVPRGPINNIPTLVQVMAWRRPGDKPLSEPMMVRLPTHICVTRPQWVNMSINSLPPAPRWRKHCTRENFMITFISAPIATLFDKGFKCWYHVAQNRMCYVVQLTHELQNESIVELWFINHMTKMTGVWTLRQVWYLNSKRSTTGPFSSLPKWIEGIYVTGHEYVYLSN